MNQDHAEILTESVSEVLETIAYLCPVPVAGEENGQDTDSDGKSDCIGITFQGPVSGKLFITFPDTLSLMIAASMLGIEENDPDLQKKRIDAIKEILNIICGNLLIKLYGESVVFRIGSPYLIENIEIELREGDYTEMLRTKLMVDEHPVTCVMLIQENSM